MITENEIKETLRHKTTAPQSLLLQIVGTFSRKKQIMVISLTSVLFTKRRMTITFHIS